MIDARNVYRKVNRTINDFSPEQMANLSAIVWLYRGHKDRFLALVQKYLATTGNKCTAIPSALATFDATLATLQGKTEAISDKTLARDLLAELTEASTAYAADAQTLNTELAKYARKVDATPPATTKPQHATRQAFDPLAERIKGLIKQIDLLAKFASRAHDDLGKHLAALDEAAREELGYDRRGASKLLKQLDDERKDAVEQLRQAVYFHRQAAWLLDRFPDGKLADVPGLVKLVSRLEIAAADSSLTPGRYVGVAPADVDEDFDFEQKMRDIHTELADLNEEAAVLAAKIQKGFEELRI
jgi:type I restriction enzyme M protein